MPKRKRCNRAAHLGCRTQDKTLWDTTGVLASRNCVCHEFNPSVEASVIETKFETAEPGVLHTKVSSISGRINFVKMIVFHNLENTSLHTGILQRSVNNAD